MPPTLYRDGYEYENCRYRYGCVSRADDFDGTGDGEHSNANSATSEWDWFCADCLHVLHA